MGRKVVKLTENRVEGDLSLRVEVEDGVVREAYCAGVMFRGFEGLMVGRAPLDALVITPRICGVCSTAHLTAAARALEALAGVRPPQNAQRIRNVAAMTEMVQSDLRHTFLMFTTDFVNAAYRGSALHAEAAARYQPFSGETFRQVVQQTKQLVEVVAILGGQWPHSSYMVPGGIVSNPGSADLMQCRQIVRRFTRWYEGRVLGCSLERWLEVRRASDLERWLEERQEHRDSDLGFFLRFGREQGLERLGRGHNHYLSYGALDLPEGTRVHGPRRQERLIPAGFAQGTTVTRFDAAQISEDTSHGWFAGDGEPLPPAAGQTVPYASGNEGQRYSWAKAPRYDGEPAETGPLAQAVVARNPLFLDLLERQGPSVLVRQLARLVRPAELLAAMETWLGEVEPKERFYRAPERELEGAGCGLTEASRGALGHWIRVEEGLIAHYQIIAPTTWQASPRDRAGVRGVTEEALVGTPLPDEENPLQVGHVVRSFDHCMVCTVHLLRRRTGQKRRFVVGGLW